MERILAGVPCVESGNWRREFVVNNLPRAVMCGMHAFHSKMSILLQYPDCFICFYFLSPRNANRSLQVSLLNTINTTY